MINTTYWSVRPSFLLLPLLCRVTICQCLKSMMFCQHCTVTPSKKKQKNKPQSTHHQNSARSGIHVLQRAKYHFCLKNSLPILNAFRLIFHLVTWPIFTQPENKNKNRNHQGQKAPTEIISSRKQGQLPAGCVGLCPTGSWLSPRWNAWATCFLTGKTLIFKLTSSYFSLHTLPLVLFPVFPVKKPFLSSTSFSQIVLEQSKSRPPPPNIPPCLQGYEIRTCHAKQFFIGRTRNYSTTGNTHICTFT